MKEGHSQVELVIHAKRSWFSFNLKEVWRYRDLLRLLVQRDFKSTYTQTVLGPIWFLISPLFTVFIYSIIFGRIAKIPTESVPPPLFYMAGIALWSYFSSCFTGVSNSLAQNKGLYGKVYFPRLIVPISILVSQLIRLGFHMLVLACLALFFLFKDGFFVLPSFHQLLFLPVWVFLTALLSLGFGLILAALTTKYLDFNHFVSFGLGLLMYASPIIYPGRFLPENLRIYAEFNPLFTFIEGFKYSLLGAGEFNFTHLISSSLITLLVLLTGLFSFNAVEHNFTDTI
jgi:lipopolysaccharide transport system permease protein